MLHKGHLQREKLNKELRELAGHMIKCLIESFKFNYKDRLQTLIEHNLKKIRKEQNTKGQLIDFNHFLNNDGQKRQ